MLTSSKMNKIETTHTDSLSMKVQTYYTHSTTRRHSLCVQVSPVWTGAVGRVWPSEGDGARGLPRSNHHPRHLPHLQGERGALRYHDVSTGHFLVEHRTKAGPCDCLSHNPHNAIVYCGHNNGLCVCVCVRACMCVCVCVYVSICILSLVRSPLPQVRSPSGVPTWQLLWLRCCATGAQ